MSFDMDTGQLEPEEVRPDGDPSGADARGRGVRPAGIGVPAWVAIAVVALLAGYLVLGRGASEPEGERSSLPGPSARATAPAPGPNQRQYVGVTRICSPVTDGRRTLTVSFEVSNVSNERIGVHSVQGVLPDGGLRQRGAAARGGDCRAPGTLQPVDSIPGGESRFYTLTFDLPDTCPARYPVLVRVGFAAAGFTESSLSLIYSDLSVPTFTTCGRPSRVTASPSQGAR